MSPLCVALLQVNLNYPVTPLRTPSPPRALPRLDGVFLLAYLRHEVRAVEEVGGFLVAAREHEFEVRGLVLDEVHDVPGATRPRFAA